LFQFRVALEKLDRDLALQGTHQLGDGDLRRNRNKQMDVVLPYVQLPDYTPLPLAQRLDIMLDQFLYGALQYAQPVFRNPDNMVLALVNNMAKFPIFTHEAKIGIAVRT